MPIKIYAADKRVGGYGYGYLPKIWTRLAEDRWRQLNVFMGPMIVQKLRVV